METPEHDAWKADQYSENPREIKKANETRLILIRTIRDELNRIASETTLDETDVGDLGMLLPDLEDDLLGSRGHSESLVDESKDSKINIRIEESPKRDENPIYTETSGEGGFNSKGKKSKSKNPNSPEGGQTGIGTDRIATNSLNIRLFKKNQNKYRMVLNCLKDIANGEILISAVGEDSRTREEISVTEALDGLKSQKLMIKNNRIKIGDLLEGEKIIVDFKPDIIEQLSMEVVVYAD